MTSSDTPRPRGKFRVVNEVRGEDASGGLTMHWTEAEYRAARYEPPFDELPWSSDPNVFIPAPPRHA
jgi:hypothetical protein